MFEFFPMKKFKINKHLLGSNLTYVVPSKFFSYFDLPLLVARDVTPQNRMKWRGLTLFGCLSAKWGNEDVRDSEEGKLLLGNYSKILLGTSRPLEEPA